MKKRSFIGLLIYILLLVGCTNKEAKTQSENSSVDSNIIQNNSNKLGSFNKIMDTSSYKNWKDIRAIPVPQNYKRIPANENSFSEYLRNFPIKKRDNLIHDYTGAELWDQESHIAILEIDVGDRDLQQCADAVMRLRAEYLYKLKRYNQIHFNFVSGKKADYQSYCQQDYSYKKFRRYMDWVFSYANTASLKKELSSVDNINNIEIGDVFIQTGNPYGHAIIVVDVAKHNDTGNKLFLIAQSFMPAQEIHILKNPVNQNLSPWYSVEFKGSLETPKWTFEKSDLRRF